MFRAEPPATQGAASPGPVRRLLRGRPRRSLLSTLVAIPALVTLVACAGTPPTQPNVTAVATQAAAAATLAASPIATAQAAASPALATVQAIASPGLATATTIIASPIASPSPSPSPIARTGSSTLRIADASLGDATPWMSLRNDSDTPVDLDGWELQVGSATIDLPANAVIQPRSTLTLHAGTGLSDDDEIYLGSASDALVAAAQPGATVRLTDDDGRLIAETTIPRF